MSVASCHHRWNPASLLNSSDVQHNRHICADAKIAPDTGRCVQSGDIGEHCDSVGTGFRTLSTRYSLSIGLVSTTGLSRREKFFQSEPKFLPDVLLRSAPICAYISRESYAAVPPDVRALHIASGREYRSLAQYTRAVHVPSITATRNQYKRKPSAPVSRLANAMTCAPLESNSSSLRAPCTTTTRLPCCMYIETKFAIRVYTGYRREKEKRRHNHQDGDLRYGFP